MSIILFTLSTFKPSKAIATTLTEMKVPFKEVVVDYNKVTEELANEYEVNTVPTIVVLEGSKIVDRITGYQTRKHLEERLKQYK